MPGNSHYGLVADCPGDDCDGQLIEKHRAWPDDRVHVGLLCHDCSHSATVEWAQGDDPLADAETSEPLDGLQVREIQWIDCRTCHGAGTVPEWGIRSGRRSCPNCNRSGTVPRLPVTDGGQSVDGTELPTPYEPAFESETMDDLDGIDLDEGEGCPHCGGRRDNLYCPNAGYYGCSTCGAVWAGDRSNASLEMEPHSGPVRSVHSDGDHQ